MVEDLIALLEKERTRHVLQDWWTGCQEHVRICATGILEYEAESYGISSEEEAFAIALAESGDAMAPTGELRREVLEKLPPPPIVTEHELAHAISRLLPWRWPDFMFGHVFDEAYPAFVNHVRSLVSARRSKPFAIAQLPFFSGRVPVDAADEVLWSEHGIAVRTCGIGRADIDPEFGGDVVSGDPQLLYARVRRRTRTK